MFAVLSLLDRLSLTAGQPVTATGNRRSTATAGNSRASCSSAPYQQLCLVLWSCGSQLAGNPSLAALLAVAVTAAHSELHQQGEAGGGDQGAVSDV